MIYKNFSLLFDSRSDFNLLDKNGSCRKILRRLFLCYFKGYRDEIFSLNSHYINV